MVIPSCRGSYLFVNYHFHLEYFDTEQQPDTDLLLLQNINRLLQLRLKCLDLNEKLWQSNFKILSKSWPIEIALWRCDKDKTGANT